MRAGRFRSRQDRLPARPRRPRTHPAAERGPAGRIVDATGFTATCDVRDGVLHHEHLVLYREGEQPDRPAQPALDPTRPHTP
ncbi:Atu4866 domain-containing protein [Streptomyces sp. LN325]|uniref:Atu4866 domain-containing protein n=1 Tax=Streptomyces sp. LN325 TaxID=3112976 RepID=UPI0037180E81